MNQFTKMVMVPQHEYFSKQQEVGQPLINQLSALDQQMQHVLQDTSIPADQKMQKYDQTVRRYRGLQNEQLYPMKSFTGNILEGMPTNARGKAKILLQHLKNNPKITWNDQNQLVIDGQPVAGSNIVDLVHDFSRNRPKAPPVHGASEFARLLEETNVPATAIGNHNRFMELGDGDKAQTSGRANNEITFAVPASSSSAPPISSETSKREKIAKYQEKKRKKALIVLRSLPKRDRKKTKFYGNPKGHGLSAWTLY